MKQLFIFSLFTFLLLSACQEAKMESGLDLANFDKTVRPQDDFYRYVNGTWLQETEIPADKSNYGSFTALYDQSQIDLRQIIEEAAHSENTSGSDRQKVGDFYLSFMDTMLIEKLGYGPLKEELARIDAVKTSDELVALIAHLKQIGVQAPFSFGVGIDAKQSDQYIIYISQSGLGLPDRDYYFKTDEKFEDTRAKYISHIETIFQLTNRDNARKRAESIFKIEKSLAENHWTRVQNRDRNKTYNKTEIKKLTQMTPDFNWSLFIEEAGVKNQESVIVRQPDYLTALNTIYKKVSLDDWKNYFAFKTIDQFAALLSKDFVEANFNFYSRTLSGIEKNRERWKRGVSAVNAVLGEVVGKVYVEKHFRPEAKTRMKQLVKNLTLAYEERIKGLDWMGEETKLEALKKLSKFNAKIGYPDKWKDYSNLEISKDQLVQNYIRSNRHEFTKDIERLGKPIDRDEWFMTPQTVNAYYSPTMNEVVFPAAILQPPFFNMDADDAVNYGAIGAVIGHELTHGFDDQGSKSDGDGNLREWWTDDDRKNFDSRTQILVDQYETYTPLDSMHLNGKLTLGENIADLGGLTISYNAYHKSLKGKPAPVIDEFTGDQRFFLGWSQIWRRKYRDDELRNRILTDPHSPSEYRVIGILSNMPAFYEAFDVKETDKMHRESQIQANIW